MAISVRPVDYDSESQELIAVLQSNLPHLPHARLFPWLYLRNPEGRALVWVATDSETHRAIGIAAAFPRRTYYRGEEVDRKSTRLNSSHLVISYAVFCLV